MKRILLTCLIAAISTAVALYAATRPMEPEEAVRRVLEADHREKGSAQRCREAVDDLVRVGPEALPVALGAMPDVIDMDDLIKVDWLRSACDRIVKRAVTADEPLPTEALLFIARNKRNSDTSRVEAYKILRFVRPELVDRGKNRWLDDPVFAPDVFEDPEGDGV